MHWALPRLATLATAARPHLRHGHAFPTWQLSESAPAGGGRRPQRQEAKALAAADNSKGCEHALMPEELVQRVVEACGTRSWPEGPAGRLEGVVRLLGGSLLNEMVPQ